MTSAPDDLTALRNGIAAVLVDASTYPRSVQPHILGQDLGRLIAAVTDAAVHHVRKAQAEAWFAGYDKGNLDGYFGTSDERAKSPYADLDPYRASRIEQGDGGCGCGNCDEYETWHEGDGGDRG